MSLLRRLVTGGFWALLGKLATYPLALILAMIVARVLTPAEVGSYFLCMSIVMLSAAVIDLGMGRTMVKCVAALVADNNPKAVRQSLKIGLSIVAISATVAFLFLSNAPGRWLITHIKEGEAILPSLYWLACLIVAYTFVEFFSEVLRGFHDLRGASLLSEQTLQRFILMLILLIFFVQGWSLSLNEVLFYTFTSALTACAVGGWFVAKQLAVLGTHGQSIKARDVLIHAPTFLLIRVNFWLLNSAAILVLGIFQPPEQVALYGAANVLATLVIAPWSVCNSVLSPTVAALYRCSDLAAMSGIARAGATLATVPALVLSAILIFFGNEILTIVFTEHFASATTALMILAVGRVASVSCGAPAMLMTMTNHHSIVLRVLAFTSLLTLAAYIYFAESIGIIAVAVVTSVSYASQAIVLAAIVKRRLGFQSFPMVSVRGFKSLIVSLGVKNP